MPTYKLQKELNGEVNQFEVNCSYEEMKLLCEEYGVKLIIQAPSLISDHKSTNTRAGTEWQDLLKDIKKKSGRGNTIKV